MIERVLVTHRDVANSALAPRYCVVLRRQRQRELDHTLRAKTLLVKELEFGNFRVTGIVQQREYRFILGKRFLRVHRPRQIEFPTRPAIVGTQGAYVSKNLVRVFLGQRIAKCRHHAIECPDRSAIMNNCVPVRIRLTTRKFAIRKIRRLYFQRAVFLCPARPVFPVTGGARTLIQLGIVRLLRSAGY